MITVIDAPCGTGKTTYCINYMKEHPTQKFIYITPYLDEVERIQKEIDNIETPDTRNERGTKLESMKDLLINPFVNIVSTHSLFERFTPEMADLIKTQHMTLILDEVMEVVREIDSKTLHPDDVKIMLESNLISIDETTGKIDWIANEYKGNRFFSAKELIQNSEMYAIQLRNSVYNCFIWTFPPKVFEAFDDVYILTYLYKYQLQRFYYDLYGIGYNIKTLKDKKLVSIKDYEKDIPTRFLDKIQIYEGQSNIIGQVENIEPVINGEEFIDFERTPQGILSKSWYIRKLSAFKSESEIEKEKDKKRIALRNTPPSFQVFRHYIENVVKNYFKTRAEDIICTTFKDYEKYLKGKGYTNSFIPCNTRATNKYQNTHCVMYLINKYMHPFVKKFFKIHHVDISSTDEDMFALSELIQFIYRSAIRNGEEIKVYIPSTRMRRLLKSYITENTEDKILDIAF